MSPIAPSAPRRRFRRLAAVVGLGLVLAAAALAVYIRFEYTLVGDVREALAAVDESDPIARGQLLFSTRGCAGCHTLGNAGSTSSLGPGLDGIGARRNAAELRQSVLTPAAVIAPCGERACAATMPEYGAMLDRAQVDALVAFLEAQR